MACSGESDQQWAVATDHLLPGHRDRQNYALSICTCARAWTWQCLESVATFSFMCRLIPLTLVHCKHRDCFEEYLPYGSKSLLSCRRACWWLIYCNKIAEAEAAVSVNEKKWLVMHMHVQLKLDELRGPQNPWLTGG